MNVISHRIVFGSFVHNIADSKVTAHTAQHYSKCVVWLLLNLHDNRLWIAYKAHSIHCTVYIDQETCKPSEQRPLHFTLLFSFRFARTQTCKVLLHVAHRKFT